MGRILVNLIKNKRNGQINMAVPRRKLGLDVKKKLVDAKQAWINFEVCE